MHTRAAATRVMPMLPEWAQCDVEEMVELACRVNVNAHGLRGDSSSNHTIGVGVFPLIAMINHSCRPNCTFAYYGKLTVYGPVSESIVLSSANAVEDGSFLVRNDPPRILKIRIQPLADTCAAACWLHRVYSLWSLVFRVGVMLTKHLGSDFTAIDACGRSTEIFTYFGTFSFCCEFQPIGGAQTSLLSTLRKDRVSPVVFPLFGYTVSIFRVE